MDFFVKSPEMLGDSQTFIGVLLTFIVLCLFSNESNFLLKLICNMVADFTANLKENIDDINTQIDQEKSRSDDAMGEIANNRSYWANQSKKKMPELYKALMENNREEQNIRNSILEAVEPEIKTYKESEELLRLKSEHKFVSLYFLILMLIVMTVDACCVSSAVGSVFLTLECIVTSYFTGCLWYRYIVEKVEKAPQYHNHNNIFKKVLIGVLMTALLWFGIMGMSILTLWGLWVVTVGTIVLAVAAFSYWLMHNFRYTVRYNNQFIIKHALYIAFVCMVVTILVYLLCIVEVGASDGIINTIVCNLQSNLKIITECTYWVRIAFILLCAANTFFIPLLLGYFYNHNKAMRIKRIMNTSKDDIIVRLKANKRAYQNIVKNIQEQSDNL